MSNVSQPGVRSVDVETLKTLLAEGHLLADLSERVLARLAGMSQVRGLKKGEVLFREGERTDDIYIVQSGRIEICIWVPGRGCLTLLTLEPGELVGWSPLFDQPMTATAAVREDSQVIAIHARQLQQACQQDHELGYAVMGRLAEAISRRLVATRLQLLDLFADVPPSPLVTSPPRPS